MTFDEIKSNLLDSVVFDSHRGILNDHLLQEFGAQLDTGRVVLVHVKETSNDEMMDCYFAQSRSIDRGKNLDPTTGGSTMRGLAREGKFGNTGQIIRFRDTLNPENIQKWGQNGTLVVGEVCDEDIAICMFQDSEAETSPGYEQTPTQVTRDEQVYLKKTNGGKAIYEHTYIDRVDAESVLDSPLNFKLIPSEVETPTATAATPSTVTSEG